MVDSSGAVTEVAADPIADKGGSAETDGSETNDLIDIDTIEQVFILVDFKCCFLY